MKRRDFVKSAAASVGAAALATTPLSRSAHAAPAPESQPPDGIGKIRKKPNFLFIITDQERAIQHFPDDWQQHYTPNMLAMQMNGVSFNRAYCPSCMCSPSRSSLFTSLYPAQHKVTQTLSEGCPQSADEVVLDPTLPNLATVLQTAGYRCFYKGKWHMNKAAGIVAQPTDVSQYGFEDWNPPDAGGDTALYNFGGGISDNDGRFISDALNFINTYNDDAPFCLVLSLVNPHDVLSYPNTYLEGGYTDGWTQGSIGLPSTVDENLLLNHKPRCQAAFLASSAGLGLLPTDQMKTNYLNFYANLIHTTDNLIGTVIDAMRNRGFLDDTVLIRTADHGEMGMAHGGMRQKSFNMYEEALRIPLIFSNPRLYQKAFTSDQLISLVDVLPTVARLAEVPNIERYSFVGRDFSQVLLNPENAETVQDSLLFTYDDIRCGQCADEVVPPPNRMHTIIESRYKYTRYYDGNGQAAPEYEMYDLVNDPCELQNVANPGNSLYDQYTEERERLATKLAAETNMRLKPLPAAPERYFGPLTELSEEGWYASSWFGYFYAGTFPWIYHAEHGWLLCSDMGAIQDNFWFYDLQIGWFYTNPSAYPYIYNSATESWWYYDRGSSNPRYFYDFKAERWLTIPGPSNTEIAMHRANPGTPPNYFVNENAIQAHPQITPQWKSPTRAQLLAISQGVPA